LKKTNTAKKNAPGLNGPSSTSKTFQLAQNGVQTSQEFCDLMSSLMTDVLTGKVDPDVANAACNAGGKVIRLVELQYKYGKRVPGAPGSNMLLP
jgi:hypothetical protein